MQGECAFDCQISVGKIGGDYQHAVGRVFACPGDHSSLQPRSYQHNLPKERLLGETQHLSVKRAVFLGPGCAETVDAEIVPAGEGVGGPQL